MSAPLDTNEMVVHSEVGPDCMIRRGVECRRCGFDAVRFEKFAPDVHRAFDAAYKHVETQLRTYKRKLKNHHAKARARKRAEA